MDIRQGARDAVEHGEWLIAAAAVALAWAVVAVVVMLALTSPVQAQVLESYTTSTCGTAQPPVCSAANGRAQVCRAAARTDVSPDGEAFLQWAAAHRAVAHDARITLRSVRPVAVPAATDARKNTCSS